MRSVVRRAVACSGWLATAALLLSGCGQSAPADLPLSPIVVITLDTLRADHLGAYDYFRDTSPNIDELAEESVVFANAISVMGTTLPAHVSLFTSRYPIQTGVTSNGRRLTFEGVRLDKMGGDQSRVRLMAQMLRELGYDTAAFVSATPVKNNTGIDAGFDFFDQPEVGGRSGAETTDQALAWLRARATAPETGRPFFLWIHNFDPHKPYEPPAEFDVFETDGELIRFLQDRGVPEAMDPEIHDVNNSYDGEILSTDHDVSRLLAQLRSMGLWDELTLVLTSDHGEGLGQHGWIGHGEIHNEQLFVPLMIKFPKAAGIGPRRVEPLVSLIDVLPTLTARLGWPLQESDRAQFSGVDVLASRNPRRYALAQRSTVTKQWKLEKKGQREKFALVSLRWKYFYNSKGADELFDMQKDRDELHDLIEVETETAATIRDNLLAEIARYSGGDDFRVVEETLPNVLEELRALGYLQ